MEPIYEPIDKQTSMINDELNKTKKSKENNKQAQFYDGGGWNLQTQK